ELLGDRVGLGVLLEHRAQHRALPIERLDPLAVLLDQRLRGLRAGSHARRELGERQLHELDRGRGVMGRCRGRRRCRGGGVGGGGGGGCGGGGWGRGGGPGRGLRGWGGRGARLLALAARRERGSRRERGAAAEQRSTVDGVLARCRGRLLIIVSHAWIIGASTRAVNRNGARLSSSRAVS